jgi:hydrogenase-4 transcriptional activator
MKPNSASSGREKSPGTSDSSQNYTHLQPLHCETAPSSTHDSKTRHAPPLRALTELKERAGFPDFIIESPAMLDLIDLLDKVRNSAAPLLITGETGVGKEIMAQAALLFSNRSKNKFTILNCASMPRELIESHLFGHLRGSFTGAQSDSRGIIRNVEGGTLLMDEVGEIPLELQAKLLRFLQEGEVHPVGATEPVKVNVRVIAITNRDLEEDVRRGLFRADLFQRLNVLRLHIPPLRERPEEIPLLIAYFFDRFQKEMQKHGLRLNDEAMDLLCAYDWPYNIRQLEHEIYRLVARAEKDEVIGAGHISSEIHAFLAPCKPVTRLAGKIVLDLSLIDRRISN